MRVNRRAFLAGLASVTATPTAARDAGPLLAAAASLRPAIDELARVFEQQTGHHIRVSFGATGNLVRQIEQGAPFEAMISADVEGPARLHGASLTESRPHIFARGRLALVVPKTSPIAIERGFESIALSIEQRKLRKFAIANPELAPFGRAATAALERAGLRDRIAPLLVRAENVGQAAQYVASGAADAGLVALSLTRAPPLSDALQVFIVPGDWHPPIDQAMVALRTASPVTRAFLALFTSAAGRAILERHGFEIP